MFENLSERLQLAIKKLKGQTRITEKNIAEGLKEVQFALLEADVHYRVVKKFINKVKERAIGQEVLKSLTPGQQLIKIVHEELVNLLGGEYSKIKLASTPPTKIMLVGLQGSGKTTSVAKLAKGFKKQGHRPLMVAADIYRPAAIEQLKTLAKQVGVPCYAPGDKVNPVKICTDSIAYARDNNLDIVIIDTAGRLHIDEKLMDELVEIKKAINPDEILFVADAMTGQDAVNVAQKFNEYLDFDGVILTKMDSDTRGGAALSIKSVVGKPIKLIGVGEKVDLLEPFHPERMASRILGMGDILSLIEKAEQAISEEEALKMQKKILEDSFTLEDFKEQLKAIKKMGPLDQLLKLIPGMGSMMSKMKDFKPPEEDLKRIEAIINSMTKEERINPSIINYSRKKRIAKGSGTTITDVNKLLKQFNEMKKMLKSFTKTGKIKKFKKRFPF